MRGAHRPLFVLLMGCGAIAPFACADHAVRVENTGRRSQDADATSTCSPAEAFARLQAGNERFVTDHPRHPRASRSWRDRLTSGQRPFAIILGCSDSRVPPELLFDQGFGDLFVLRVAGNVLDDDVLGSIEYAVEHLGTPLVAVLGHQDCGAVIAAMGERDELDHLPDALSSLLRHMQARIAEVPSNLPRDQRITACVEVNARWAAARLRENRVLAERIAAARLRVITGVYDLNSGAVRWIEGLDDGGQ